MGVLRIVQLKLAINAPKETTTLQIYAQRYVVMGLTMVNLDVMTVIIKMEMDALPIVLLKMVMPV